MMKIVVQLVVASACDHYTRISTGGSKLAVDSPVYGLLFGTKIPSSVAASGGSSAVEKVEPQESYFSVCDSVDLNYIIGMDGKASIVDGEIERKTKLWTAVFKTFSLIGWYSFGGSILPEHHTIHREVGVHTTSAPLFLLINPSADSDSDELPLGVYSAATNKEDLNFQEAVFRIETSEVEKVALDHITKSTPVPGLSALEVQNETMLTSLRILDKKVGDIVEVLQGMQAGATEVDHNLLRRAAKICQSLPPIDAHSFEKDYRDDVTNSLLVSYLCAATATVGQFGETSDLFSSTYGERGAGGGGGGGGRGYAK
mmetsp:Transcript_29520/g.49420  ORF Transcript_29520/g.49420 Transcript_29520/m.49420 type:complete len:314 (+) Transcript_29520:43-984(+)